MIILNRLYGILTDGDNTVRRTTTNRSELPGTAKKIVTALMPDKLSPAGMRALAEIYIRLCRMHTPNSELLDRVDPLNSYNIHSFDERFSDTKVLDDIVPAIRRIGLPDEENSFLPVDYIVNALYHLLELLDAGA